MTTALERRFLLMAKARGSRAVFLVVKNPNPSKGMGLWGRLPGQQNNHKGNLETSLPKVQAMGRSKGPEPSGRGSLKVERDASLISLLSDG